MLETINWDDRFAQIAKWFEHLTPETLGLIDKVYAIDAKFVDPFNNLLGRPSVEQVYRHMFKSLTSPRFIVSRTVNQGAHAFMLWDFKFLWRNQARTISGCTHFELNELGLISLHRDYWDAAHEFYEKLPVLGVLLRYLRRSLAIKKTAPEGAIKNRLGA